MDGNSLTLIRRFNNSFHHYAEEAGDGCFLPLLYLPTEAATEKRKKRQQQPKQGKGWGGWREKSYCRLIEKKEKKKKATKTITSHNTPAGF